ncbi:DnaA regulatory inactivator Hda [Zhongshania guokunii]|uniref:DnaA regulatory inactivator Hda n=1 Tax=Zhongshania guokunii TaxID=641783 RepID=A0ABV3U2Y8_9GAMM
MASQQLPLALKLDNEATFDNFYLVEEHRLVVNQLRLQASGEGEKWVYLGGGAGRSHLLQACCHLAEGRGLYARYIPLAEVVDYEPEALLEGSEYLDLLCLDDLEAVAGRANWERALFNCYNQMLTTESRMLIASAKPLSQQTVELPDLRSRLQSFSGYFLRNSDEAARLAAFQFRASLRGITISDAVAEYIYMRCQRDLASLFGILNTLDRLSLAEQRKFTIPFIKKAMGW